MSLYANRLQRLRKELSEEIKHRKKRKKKFTNNQQIMIDFINGVTKKAIFIINSRKIILKRGNQKYGFQHILEKHYCLDCDGKITLRDILNIDLTILRGIVLNTEGVSNTNNIVFFYLKGAISYKLVMREEKNNEIVVSYYTVN